MVISGGGRVVGAQITLRQAVVFSKICRVNKAFGQQDDITVLTLASTA